MVGFLMLPIKYEKCEIILCIVDERVQPLREIFQTYELLAYLSVRATQIGDKVCEVLVFRVYPNGGKTPTKISLWKGNKELLRILFRNMMGMYNPGN